MNRRQALDLVSDLPGRELKRLFAAAKPISGLELRPGLYRGRNGGGPPPAKWVARTIVQRDWFAKLVLDGYGINVRCRQDDSHGLRPSRSLPGGVVVDLPFRLTAAGLDYQWHLLGHDLAALQFRDLLASVDFRSLADAVADADLQRVGVRRGEASKASEAGAASEEGELVIGLMAPAGLRALAGMPFGMVWDREPTPAEVESCHAYLRRRRWLDTSCGQLAASGGQPR